MTYINQREISRLSTAPLTIVPIQRAESSQKTPCTKTVWKYNRVTYDLISGIQNEEWTWTITGKTALVKYYNGQTFIQFKDNNVIIIDGIHPISPDKNITIVYVNCDDPSSDPHNPPIPPHKLSLSENDTASFNFKQ